MKGPYIAFLDDSKDLRRVEHLYNVINYKHVKYGTENLNNYGFLIRATK